MGLMLTLASCKRNYQVNYARVAVDTTLQHNDVVPEDIDTLEDELDFLDDDAPIIEVPDIPQERTPVRGVSRKSLRSVTETENINSGKDY